MSAGKINLQANDGFVLGLTAPDGMGANVNDIVARKSEVNLKADTTYVDAQVATKATLAEAQAYDLGVGQTWQDVKASRSVGVTYTNSAGKPIFFAVTGAGAFSANLYFYVDGYLIGSIDTGDYYSSTGNVPNKSMGCILVPIGSTYKVTIDAGITVNYWSELR